MRQCEVYVHGIKAGVLKEDEDGYSFAYNKTYLQGKKKMRTVILLPTTKLICKGRIILR